MSKMIKCCLYEKHRKDGWWNSRRVILVNDNSGEVFYKADTEDDGP